MVWNTVSLNTVIFGIRQLEKWNSKNAEVGASLHTLERLNRRSGKFSRANSKMEVGDPLQVSIAAFNGTLLSTDATQGCN